jgi:Cd2+/Zn2+-exporting ATPase
MGVDVQPATRFAAVPGMGAEGDVGGVRILVGNERLFGARAIPVGTHLDFAALRNQGRSIVLVAIDGQFAGLVALADRARKTAREAIGLLREQGIQRVAMLTGDHEDTARTVAADVGVDEYHAGLLPDDKHALVKSLRERHGVLLMVGDGINDAPALAAADVGVAMGAAGSDVALETADVALMSDELLKLPYAIRLARATLRNVRTNVAISLVLKAAFLVMAITGSATLWMAVLADTGASVIVVGNALRLLKAR